MTTATALPPAPRRLYGWRSWSDVGREAILAALMGVVILIVESGGQDHFPHTISFVRNIILGISIFLVARGMETMLSWAIEQSRYPTFFRTLLYAAGGWLGYFFGLTIISQTIGLEHDDLAVDSYHFRYAIFIAAVISILIGFILHHNRKRNDRLAETIARLKEHEYAQKELEIARSMQRRLLPPPRIERDGYRVTARSEAAHIVGGDFYDVLRLQDGSVAILAADVSGKGIAASLVMATCKAMIPFLASSGRAADVMRMLNESLYEQLERREFVAMAFARFDPATGDVEMVNAGMPDPYILRADGTLITLDFEGERFPLGTRRSIQYTATRERLDRGDRLIVLSDGFPEAVADDAPVGYDRVEALVRSFKSADALIDELRALEGVRVDDDVTVVVLERS